MPRVIGSSSLLVGMLAGLTIGSCWASPESSGTSLAALHSAWKARDGSAAKSAWQTLPDKNPLLESYVLLADRTIGPSMLETLAEKVPGTLAAFRLKEEAAIRRFDAGESLETWPDTPVGFCMAGLAGKLTPSPDDLLTWLEKTSNHKFCVRLLSTRDSDVQSWVRAYLNKEKGYFGTGKSLAEQGKLGSSLHMALLSGKPVLPEKLWSRLKPLPSWGRKGLWAFFRLALARGDRKAAALALAAIPDKSVRAEYWHARLKGKRFRPDDSWFGLMAGTASFRHEDAPPCRKPAPAEAGLARLFRDAGLYAEASRLWSSALDTQGTPECLLDENRPSLHLAAAARLGSKNQWTVWYKPEIERAAKRHGIPFTLLVALIRQESRFEAGISSHAGAVGLAQVMPATAQQLGVRGDLKNPEVSVEAGATYLSAQLRKFGDVRWALAAYNAGPGRALRWQAAFGHLAYDEAVEAIPFDETRGYVEKVLWNVANYEKLVY